MINRIPYVATSHSDRRILYRVGSVAALVGGLIFRRNLGVEIGLFSAQKQPGAVADWFALLQTHRLLGLAYLNLFDVINYILVGLMFLALAATLSEQGRSATAAIAVTLGFGGIVVYLASNTALSLLSLSDQYVAATDETQRMLLLAAGQALLALNRFSSSGAHPGAPGYLSLLLVGAAGLLFSTLMLRSRLFGRAAGWLGIGANGLDLGYCAAFLFAPAALREHLAVLFIPAAGLLFMLWHILIGWWLVTRRAAV